MEKPVCMENLGQVCGNSVPIDWRLARRAMLTQINLFPENTRANCMSEEISSEQLEIVIRCMRVFFNGLKWADEFGICGGFTGNKNFHRVFQIEDDYILGIFDNRNPVINNVNSSGKNPASLCELIDFYKTRYCNIKTLVVLEKKNLRLASSEPQGRQSKFLIDALYPALSGVCAKFSEHYNDFCRCQTLLSALGQVKSNNPYSNNQSYSSNQSTQSPLLEIYKNQYQVDDLLFRKSLFQLFLKPDSPLNRDIDNLSRAS